MKILWFKVRNDLFEYDFSATRIAIYAYLSMLSNRDGYCQVRHSTIAKKTDTSRRTVIRALDDLQDQGLIKIINDGEGSNKYIIPANMEDISVLDRQLKREFDEQNQYEPGNSLTPEGRRNVYYDWINNN